MARDSLAPRKTPDRWLPREDWVYRHWSPFSQSDLERELTLAPGQLEALLFDDRRTLIELARVKGVDPAALRDRLVEPATAGVSADRVLALRSRAWRVLTQGHLAQHLFYHPYHGLDVRANAPMLFGLTPRRYWRLRLAGRTPRQILRIKRRPAVGLYVGMRRLFDVDDAEGVRLQVTSPAATNDARRRREAELSCWSRSALPGIALDTKHPYGEQHKIRGRRGSLRNTADLRADERLIERFRRQLPSSCWVIPDAWRGPQVPRARSSDPDPDPALQGYRDPASADDPATASRVPRYVCGLQV